MAIIVSATTYPDGLPLSVVDHNENVYSTSNDKGVLSVPNGGLDITNLSPSFIAQDEHVMSEEAVIARSEGTVTPIDIYSNALGATDLDDKNFVPIGGLCQRVYAPFDCAAALWQWSYFISASRFFERDEEYVLSSKLMFQLRVYVDGQEYPAYRRRFTPSLSKSTAGGSDIKNYEAICAVYNDLAIVAPEMTKGFHNIAVKLFMQYQLTEGEEGTPKGVLVDYRLFTNGLNLELTEGLGIYEVPDSDRQTLINLDTEEPVFGGDLYGGITCQVLQRVTFGTRSVRCVLFK